MDPVDLLPVEVLDYIWSMLPMSDVYSCLAVSRSWKVTLSECATLWRPLCSSNSPKRDGLWYDIFLEESKLRWPWKVGSFSDGEVIENFQSFCCTENFIYIINFNNYLQKYSPSAKLLKKIQIPADVCSNIHSVNTNIAVFCTHSDWNEIIIFNDELEIIARLPKIINSVCSSGERLWVRSAINDQLVYVYYAQNLTEDHRVEQIIAHPDATLMPLHDGWCTMVQGLVCQVTDVNDKVRLYQPPQTPMSRIFMTMITDNKDTVAIIDKKIIAGKHIFCTIFIYKNGIRIFRADIPKHLRYWCFSGQYLVLASIKDISSIHLTTGTVHIGEEIKGLNLSDYIYDVQRLFDQPKYTWVIVNHGINLAVYDVINICNLIVIDCDRTESIITSPINVLFCLKKMLVYTTKENKLMVKETLLK